MKDCDIVLYHPDKENIVVDALSIIIMGNVAHVPNDKKELMKDVHRLAQLDIRLEDSPDEVLLFIITQNHL